MTIQDESILLEAKADSEKEFYVGEWTNIPKGYLAIHLQVLKKNGFKPVFWTEHCLIEQQCFY